VTAEALYRKVAGDIKAAIASGAYPPGALLPSEAELAGRYLVARGTVRQAFAALCADGVIACPATRPGPASRPSRRRPDCPAPR
jgi:DNA-binding GntR family transcriptional regulator